MSRSKLVKCFAVLVIVTLAFWCSQQEWFPHKVDYFKQRKVAAILIMKVGPDNVLTVAKKIEDPTKITWLCKQLDDGYVTWFRGFFGVLLPVDIFLDDRGQVIAAAYCRTPEYRVCFVDVIKKGDGYIISKDNDDYGIHNREYVQEMAKLSDIEIPSSER